MNLLELMGHTPEEIRQAEEGRARDIARRQAARRDLSEIPMRRQQQAMFDSVADWRPPELPSLDRYKEVILDLETEGLRWWENDRMIGAGLWTPDGQCRYFPVRHRVGPNLPLEQVLEWFRREFRGKRVVNTRTKFDLHMLRVDGIDLDAQGCTFGDVSHYAALLDDRRRTFNQEDLVRDFLGEEGGKVREAGGYELDPRHYADYPAGLVRARAEHDVLMVARLQQAMWPRMTAEGLHRVREIEDGVIPVVVEMEHNGCPIDVELLERWCAESERDVEAALYEVKQLTGVDLESPNKRKGIESIFRGLGLPVPRDAETGEPSYADHLLADVDHPAIVALRRAKALASLRSKFLLKYLRSVEGSGILRYELHQLPYEDDAEGHGGAVSGRFSSAALTYFNEEGRRQQTGMNIQQIFGVKSQANPKRDFNPTAKYIVRQLHVPGTARAAWLSADMRQIEYRRFVHYSNAERLIASYMKDPLTDYHALVHGLILEHTGQDFERTHVKNLNFASLYGAGLIKIALMVGEIDDAVYQELRRAQIRVGGSRAVRSDPRVAKTYKLYSTYHEMFPEVHRLLDLAAQTAMPGHDEQKCRPGCTFEHRGYVKTILGRRARFQAGDRLYSALNRVIQGTAADDNKAALIDVHRERKHLGFVPRLTVHDELGGDLLEPESLPRMAKFLNQQRLECRVPILWDTNAGANWAEAK